MPETGLMCVNEKPPLSAPLSSKLVLHLKSPACASSLASLWMLCNHPSILRYTLPDVSGTIFNLFNARDGFILCIFNSVCLCHKLQFQPV